MRQARPFSCCSENSIEKCQNAERKVIKDLHQRLKDELKLVFRDPSDLGKVRTKSTPSKNNINGKFRAIPYELE